MSVQNGAKESAKRKLVKNTAYLYILTFSSQAISFLTIPYQTRILGPELYGVVGFIVAAMTIFSLCLNYGFLYSGTQAVAEYREDIEEVSKVYTAIFVIKLLIGLMLLAVPVIVLLFFPESRQYGALVILYYAAYFVAGLLPDYLYRGLEEMKLITVRTVAIRLVAAGLIFLFLKSEQDVYVLPLSLLVGNAGALLACFWYDIRKLKMSFVRIEHWYILEVFRKGAPFFVSRIASVIYQSGNAIVLGIFYPGSPIVGWFNSADKFLTLMKQVSSPIADSIYPFMIRNKDYRLSIRIMIISAPVIILFCTLLFMEANLVCAFVFGEDYYEAGNVLRCLIPAIAVILPTYIICFPILVPMGLQKYANISNVVGMFIQMALLLLLLSVDKLDVYSVCVSASVSEVSVFLYRLGVMIHFRKRMSRR